MLKRITLLILSTGLLSGPAFAKLQEVSCDDRVRLQETLTEVLGAQRQGMGLRDPDTTLEIWTLSANDEWLIVQNYANGTSCIVAMGEYWEDVIPEPA